jgi:hypothetical protein
MQRIANPDNTGGGIANSTNERCVEYYQCSIAHCISERTGEKYGNKHDYSTYPKIARTHY